MGTIITLTAPLLPWFLFISLICQSWELQDLEQEPLLSILTLLEISKSYGLIYHSYALNFVSSAKISPLIFRLVLPAAYVTSPLICSKCSLVLTSPKRPLIFPQTHSSVLIHIVINTTLAITQLKPKILQYSCLFFLSHPILNPLAKPWLYLQNIPESNHFSPTPSNIMSPFSYCRRLYLVSVLPFLHYFGLFSIRQPEEPLKQVISCHTSVNSPLIPNLTYSNT